MYGLVNKAVEDLVTKSFGAEKWHEVRRKAGLDDTVSFVSMHPYQDKVTYDLVGAASETLGLSPQQVLEAFGEHWTVYTAQEGYGPMMELCGSSFLDFLENLDNLHTRVGLSFPHLRPPSFEVIEQNETTARLRYTSERDGLAPLVVGLLRGLAKRFETEVDIVQDKFKGVESDCDEFLLTFL